MGSKSTVPAVSFPPAVGRGLDGKVAIVSGAGSRGDGIGNGRVAAILLAREGARVGLLDAVPEWAAETLRVIESEGGTALAITGDVTESADCEAAVRSVVEAWGRLDVLVNNVGVGGPPGTAVDVDPGEWDRAMRVNWPR